MIKKQPASQPSLSNFLSYLAMHVRQDSQRLPTLSELSQEMGVSTASVREQLEVARALKLVEVKPRTGIKPLPYNFSDAIHISLNYAIEVNPELFRDFSDLRKKIEAAYWYEVAAQVTGEDIHYLNQLVDRAMEKLRSRPPQIPQWEHRELHTTLYKRLRNPFVLGLLEAYWDLYEQAGLNSFVDLAYLEAVWQYHQSIVSALEKGDLVGGYKMLTEHMNLLYQRPHDDSRQKFE